ncbi:MAG: S8 family serine peptidase [Pirellulales bacterium]|nr:S8 family serine peptidase [Pirellulales bacterium]
MALSAGGLSELPLLLHAAAHDDAGSAAATGSDRAGDALRTAWNLGELTAPREVSGSVGGTDSRDVFRFDLNRRTEVRLGLDGLQQDVDLFLYDGKGKLLGRSTSAGRQAESIRRTLGQGTYYVAVDPYWNFSSDYRLGLNVPGAAPDPGTGEGFPDVPYFGGQNQWNLNAINAPEAWAQGYLGEGIIAAVVDTGVDLSHPELTSSLWVNQGEVPGNGRDDDANGFVDDVRGWDFANGDNSPMDQNGHGTHVAGTIAAANDGRGATGVAPGVTIMPVQVLDSQGAGATSAVAAGIRYAVNNGADLINLSLGGGFSSAILSALEYAAAHSVMVIAAAGNRGAASPDYPAAHSATLSNVLSVEAHSEGNAKATFSNGAVGAVQVAAPGVDIYSTLPGGGFGRMSGTSMAAPHVTGLAALALSANPALTPEQLRGILVGGADRAISGSNASGGVNAAVTVALAASPTLSGSAVAASPARTALRPAEWSSFSMQSTGPSDHALSAAWLPQNEQTVGSGRGFFAGALHHEQTTRAIDAAFAEADLSGRLTPGGLAPGEISPWDSPPDRLCSGGRSPAVMQRPGVCVA